MNGRGAQVGERKIKERSLRSLVGQTVVEATRDPNKKRGRKQ